MQSTRRSSRLALLLCLGVVLIWHAPVFLGRQPAGGDITSFFYPLMSFYSDRLAEGELPIWNPLWGYGFPGLAESQMGVFYPPHLVLFGLLGVDLAYSLNLLLHALLAAGFAFWCARSFGLGPWGSALAAIVFARGGFFVGHVVHQWAYTAGCWLPLAVLLTWRLANGRVGEWASGTPNRRPGRRLSAPKPETRNPIPPTPNPRPLTPRFPLARSLTRSLALAIVLAVQMLAGHFQLAFYTQASVLLVAGVGLVQGCFQGEAVRRRNAIAGFGLVVGAWIGSLALAAVQLLPTAELAGYSSARMRHDFAYLSGFANTPWHVVHYFFPLLLHRNPLWRTVAWDPWHTSPEECFVYVGLVPLCLAAGALWRWRRDARVRVWTILLIASVLFSLGPFLPGFRALILLPGFGWFRSAARWSLVSTLALGLLAGFALDRLDADRLRRWFQRFALGWLAVLLLIGAAVAVLFNKPGETTWLTRSLGAVWHGVSPWKQDADLPESIEAAHTMQCGEFQVVGGLVGLGYDMRTLRTRQCTLITALPAIAWQEIAPSVAALIVFAALVLTPLRRTQFLGALLVVFTAGDLAMLGLVHRMEWIPRGSLRQSALMSWLADHAEGERIVAPFFDNLPMAAETAAFVAYRTLEIPVFPQYLGFVRESRWNELPEPTSRLLRLSAARYHLVQGNWPHGMRAPEDPRLHLVETLSDPIIDRIEFGRRYAEQLRAVGSPAVEYRIYRSDAVLSRVWVISESNLARAQRGTSDLPELKAVRPITLRTDQREHLAFDVTVDEPSMVVVTDLYYPGWEATVTDEGGRSQRRPVLKLFDAWRGVKLEAPATYHVEMTYRSNSLRLGAMLSASGAAAWLMLLLGCRASERRMRSRQSGRVRNGP